MEETLHIEPFVDSAFPNPHSAMEETLHIEPFVDSAFPNPHSAMEETLHIEPFVDSAFPNPHSAMEETLHLGPPVAIANYQSLTPKTSGSMRGCWGSRTVRLVRHRQTKGAETDRPGLPAGGQCSTLPQSVLSASMAPSWG